MQDLYIRMMALIVPESVDALLKLIDENMCAGGKRVHLMLSTAGGNVAQGISLANYLLGIPLEVYTYNFGAVDSIGVPVYAAGTKRICTPQSRFMLHRVSVAFIDNQTVDEQTLLRKREEILVDTRNIAGLISMATGNSVDRVVAAMNNETFLDAAAAVEWGLVHEIQSSLIPSGASFCTISRDCSVSRYVTSPPAGDETA